MADLLEAKVQISGTEEALTDFAAAQQRATAAVEAVRDKGDLVAHQEVDKILGEASATHLQDIRQVTQRYVRELNDLAKSFKTVADATERERKKQAQRPTGILPKISKELKKVTEKTGAFAGRVVGDAGRAVSGILSSFSSALPLGVGGLVGLMLYGVAKDQELRAQSNRFMQIWEESMQGAGAASDRASRSAAAGLAATAKELEVNFKATRGEIEAVGRAFATAGISASEAADGLTDAIGKEQKNLYMLSLTLERHYELAGGTVAKQAAEFMTKYGMSTDEAADAIINMNVAGASSGIGIGNFTNIMSQAASAVRFLGVDVRDIVGMTQQLQKSYEEMGIGKHLAGDIASRGMQAAMTGIANASVGVQAMIAQFGGWGEGMQGRFEMLSELTEEGKASPEGLRKIVKGAWGAASQALGGSQDIYLVRAKLGQMLGGDEAAKSLMGMKKIFESGRENTEAGKKELQRLSRGLQSEEQKTSQFRRFTDQMLRAMSELGMAMFNATMAFFAELVLSVRFWISILRGDSAQTMALAKAMKDVGPVFSGAIRDAGKAFKRAKGAFGEIDFRSLDLLGQSLEGLFSDIGVGDIPEAGAPAAQAIQAAPAAISQAAANVADPARQQEFGRTAALAGLAGPVGMGAAGIAGVAAAAAPGVAAGVERLHKLDREIIGGIMYSAPVNFDAAAAVNRGLKTNRVRSGSGRRE